jgi:hypothetical protein
VIRPILSAFVSVNHSAPSGPVAIDSGLLARVGIGNSVTFPLVVIRPILLAADSVNQSAPSGPAAIPHGPLLAVGSGYSVTLPVVVSLPIALAAPEGWVNHRAPSGPSAIPIPLASPENPGIGNSVKLPAVVIRPILGRVLSVNQSALSGPEVIPKGSLLDRGPGSGNSVTLPEVVIRPMELGVSELEPSSVNQSAPSGPAAIWIGRLGGGGIGNSVMAGLAAAGTGAAPARSVAAVATIAVVRISFSFVMAPLGPVPNAWLNTCPPWGQGEGQDQRRESPQTAGGQTTHTRRESMTVRRCGASLSPKASGVKPMKPLLPQPGGFEGLIPIRVGSEPGDQTVAEVGEPSGPRVNGRATVTSLATNVS